MATKPITAHKGIDWQQVLKRDKLHKKMPLTHLARELGVSPNSVRSAMARRGIEVPDQERLRKRVKREAEKAAR